MATFKLELNEQKESFGKTIGEYNIVNINNVYRCSQRGTNKNKMNNVQAGLVRYETPIMGCCMGKVMQDMKPRGRALKRLKYTQRFKQKN